MQLDEFPDSAEDGCSFSVPRWDEDSSGNTKNSKDTKAFTVFAKKIVVNLITEEHLNPIVLLKSLQESHLKSL